MGSSFSRGQAGEHELYEKNEIDVAEWTSRETDRKASMRTGVLRVTENGRSRNGASRRASTRADGKRGHTKASSSYDRQDKLARAQAGERTEHERHAHTKGGSSVVRASRKASR